MAFAANGKKKRQRVAETNHNQLITRAARAELPPIGCIEKGRSRIWLDDQRWWVTVVEFQPSGRSKGSCLNVGACWLWHAKDHFTFERAGSMRSG